jgi:P-type E1-E2 ATPase
MIEINIPGRDPLKLEHLVCDVNGTLALDGKLIDGVARRLQILRDRLVVHLLTADTHGRQSLIDSQLGLSAKRLFQGGEAEQKASYVRELGADQVVAIGQGANDAGMLAEAAIGICILSREGTSASALRHADIIIPDILSALEMLEKPLRLIATLRQ